MHEQPQPAVIETREGNAEQLAEHLFHSLQNATKGTLSEGARTEVTDRLAKHLDPDRLKLLIAVLDGEEIGE